jgi:hypothetical protein
MRKGVNEKESAFRMTTWVFLAVCGIFISDPQRVYGAEQLRPAVLQVPSIDTGTTLLLLYGKRWDLFKQ